MTPKETMAAVWRIACLAGHDPNITYEKWLPLGIMVSAAITMYRKSTRDGFLPAPKEVRQ